MEIPFLSFEHRNRVVKEEILKSFEEFFDSQWYILGDRVKDFETAYATFNHTKHCIGVSNGLDALHLSLRALGIGEGDEVIVPSNTFIASALAVSYTGAKPVFVEPRIETYNINPELIPAAITSKTKAIMPVHLYGQACEMGAIMDIANEYGLYVVEDNAQAQGATWKGQITGSFGDINGVSFYPGKNLGALGDAGAITTNNNDLAEKAFSLRNYGSSVKYKNELIGYNNRLDECQAAFLNVFLKHLPDWNKERQTIANWYNQAFRDINQIILPKIQEGATSVYHLYVIRTKKRNELQKYLKGKGVGTLIHYPTSPHLQECYKHLKYNKGDFPIAEEIANTGLSLPLWIGMTKSHVEYLVKAINEYSQTLKSVF